MMKEDPETLYMEFRSQEGYGDFITGLCYAHSSVLKYQRPVHIKFHWPNPKDHLLSDIDKESILYRFDYIREYLRPVEGLTISHEFSSVPKYRFINELEEFNHLHGLWYLKEEPKIKPGLVAFWSSKHNLTFPGYHKDPIYDHWDTVVDNLRMEGYEVVEITYRTPIKKVMELITTCEFGIGYEGMVHQLFKFTWRPIVIASKRVELATLLAPQGAIVTSPNQLLHNHISKYVNQSKKNIKRLLSLHQEYLNDVQDPTKHILYGKET